jgi:hypothetical protein
MGTTQQGNVNNLLAGPAQITFKGVAMGFTQDGATISIESADEIVRVDEMGETPVDALHTADIVNVTVRLSEWSISKLKELLPAGTFVQDGAKEKITIGKATGLRMSSVAGLLTLHPIALDAADVSQDFTAWKAYVSEPVEYVETYNDIRSYEITFSCLADMGRADGDRVAVIGDISAAADVTAPSVASVLPVDGAGAVVVSDNVVFTLVDDDLDENTMDATTVMLIDDSSDTQVAAALSWNSTTKEITLNPTSNMAAATKHRTVVNGLKDVNGNQMVTAFSSDFTTA